MALTPQYDNAFKKDLDRMKKRGADTAVSRALVTILDEEPAGSVSETALLSEASLAEDWNRPEEDEAWSYLQPAR